MNPFEQFGAKGTPHVVQRRQEAAQKRALAHKKAEEARQASIAEAQRRREEAEYPPDVVKLFEYFDTIGTDSAAQVLQICRQEWIRSLPKDMRVKILGRLDTNIIRIRLSQELPAIDDPLPPQMAAPNSGPVPLFFRAKDHLIPEEMSR